MTTSPIVLAYSGGLDTSFCVPWLSERYRRPVVTLTVNTGGIASGRPNLWSAGPWNWGPNGICWWKRVRNFSMR